MTSPGETLIGGRWRVEGFLGGGGFADVFSAVDTSPVGLGTVAVKVVRPDTMVGDHEAFLTEARTLATLRHPNVIGYLDSGLDQVSAAAESERTLRPYLVMERCEQTLTEYLNHHPTGVLGEGDTLELLAELTAGLAYLHSRGLIHRDITPGNVLGADGGWKLADFGLTRPATPDDRGPDRSVLIGTPGYVAPELFLGATASPAADIFALGALARRCCTGSPWPTGQPVTTDPHISTPTPTVTPPGGLGRLIDHCTAPDPGRRPTALQLLDLLQHSRNPAPSHDTNPDRGTVFDHGRARWLAQLGIPALLLAIATGWSTLTLITPPDPATPALHDGGQRTAPAHRASPTVSPHLDATARRVLNSVTQPPPAPPVLPPAPVVHPLTHLVSIPCAEGQPPPPSVEVVNRATIPVDYQLDVELFDDDHESLGQTTDEAARVAPGASAVLTITYPDPTDPPDRCQLLAFNATPSTP